MLAEELEVGHSTDGIFVFPDDPPHLPAPGHSRVSNVSPEPSAMPTPASEVQVSDSIELTELISLEEVRESSAASPAPTQADEHGLRYLTQSSYGVWGEHGPSTSAQLPRVEGDIHPFPEPADASDPTKEWQAAAAHDLRFTTMSDFSKIKYTGMLPTLPGPTSDAMILPIEAQTRTPRITSGQDHNPSLEAHSLLAENDVSSDSDSDLNLDFPVEISQSDDDSSYPNTIDSPWARWLNEELRKKSKLSASNRITHEFVPNGIVDELVTKKVIRGCLFVKRGEQTALVEFIFRRAKIAFAIATFARLNTHRVMNWFLKNDFSDDYLPVKEQNGPWTQSWRVDFYDAQWRFCAPTRFSSMTVRPVYESKGPTLKCAQCRRDEKKVGFQGRYL